MREFSGNSPDRGTTSSRDNGKLKCKWTKVADLNIQIWATTLKHPDRDTSQFKCTEMYTITQKPLFYVSIETIINCCKS